MIKLNLTATGNEQILIKNYLEQNASETLADKINNGVKIEKDNKTLLNKKNLKGFMKYANDEARKLAEKGANCACIEDKVVFGWGYGAMHYFEEDSIESNLYNEDGTEYKVAPKVNAATKTIAKAPVKEQKKQASLFDFMDLSVNESKENEEACEVEEDEQNYEEESIEDETIEVVENEESDKQTTIDNKVVDTETGEIIEPAPSKRSSIDKQFAIVLYNLLDGKLEVKQCDTRTRYSIYS